MSTSVPETPYAIELKDLRKVYAASGKRGAVEALKGIDLAIPKGSMFALLGPNGAGKSTVINILAGLVNKTGGEAKVWGYSIDENPRQAKSSIGIVPQELNLDAFFTPFKLLELQAGLYGVPTAERRTEELLRAVGLWDKARAYARTLSGGMRRRLMVAKAMVHTPPVLVLDEPTAGVDVELRRALWDHVRAMNQRGTTVLLTTHYLEEAEELCDHIAIINEGVLVANEEKTALLRRLDSKEIILTLDRDVGQLPPALQPYAHEAREPRSLCLRYAPSKISAGALLEEVRKAGYGIIELSTREADLEDIFLKLTGRK
ncbi:MAG TPA: ABC transporter ATP-binding protein [Alphaproteobacteria bacterium]|nr:ABC transporter ATP-binding protein [Alphaproteobacteria bacterium]